MLVVQFETVRNRTVCRDFKPLVSERLCCVFMQFWINKLGKKLKNNFSVGTFCTNDLSNCHCFASPRVYFDNETCALCPCSQEIPQQMNGSDCGMFTCKYADYITKDKPITFTQVSVNGIISKKSWWWFKMLNFPFVIDRNTCHISEKGWFGRL